jgi:hypothetical protein
MPGVDALALADTGKILAGWSEISERIAKLLELLLELRPVRIRKTLEHKL